MRKIFSSNNFLTLFAVLLGIGASFFPLPFVKTLATSIMELFVNLLKMISLPIIFFAIISTVTKMESLKEAGKLLKKVLKYTLFTTFIAATVGLIFFSSLHPTAASGAVETVTNAPSGSYLSFLLKIIPANPIQAFLDNNVLGVAFMASLLSIAILLLPKTQKDAVTPFFQGIFQALLKISSWIIRIIPIGIFGFTFYFMQNLKEAGSSMKGLLLYAICVIGANIVQGFIVLPLILKSKGIAPTKLFKAMGPALLTAFFSKSSSATLPLALECAEKRAGLSRKVSSFSLPLCSVINMNGCAAFILITVLFVSMSHGLSFSIFELIGWIFISSLAAVGNAGVPMGCYFLTSALLLGMNVPLNLLGVILPLYAFFDMVETALNVWSDSSVTAAVSKELSEEEKEEEVAVYSSAD